VNQDPLTEEQLIKAIGERIKFLRIQNGKTQQQIADLSGIEESAFRRIESGRTNPTVKTLNKISLALGVSIVQLFENSN
jgi:transcriptional regulator with XRE-family HTH domain